MQFLNTANLPPPPPANPDRTRRNAEAPAVAGVEFIEVDPASNGRPCCINLLQDGRCAENEGGGCPAYWHPQLLKGGICTWFQNARTGCNRRDCQWDHVAVGPEAAQAPMNLVKARGASPKNKGKGKGGGGFKGGGPAQRQSLSPGPPKPLCIQFQRGLCQRGTSCRFSHDIPVGAPTR